MMHFCTLFDSYYLHKGIALYLSLERVTNDFHLYVMAFDRKSYDKLVDCGFDKMTVELLDDFETQGLLAVKPSRTKAEYCWTAGPSVIWYFLHKYELPDITYLDSDLFFMGNPKVIYDEIGSSSVAITEQGVSKGMEKLYGRYCVQYMYFKRDAEGCNTLAWWRDKCIEWCFQRFEDGRYGDQKYLDEFPNLSPSLCVIKNPGAGIAPWNMGRNVISDGKILWQGQAYPFVFYHMHGISANVKGSCLMMQSTDYVFTRKQVDMFLMPYAELTMDIFNHFYGMGLTSCVASGLKGWKRIEYVLRGYLRNIKIVQWLYFKVFKKIYQGHGQQF